MTIYATPAALEILRQRGITIDAAPAAPTRPAAEGKPLTALEKLNIYRKYRPRVFESAAEADEAEHREIVLLNQVNKEFWATRS